MAAFCIPRSIAATISDSFKSGELTVEKLYKMTSTQRRDAFAKYAGSDMAKEINAGFENAMLSNQQKVFKNWAEATLKGKDQAPRLKTVLDKIEQLHQSGLLTPETEQGFFHDLASEKLGISVTAEEAKQIATRSEQLTKFKAAVGDSVGNPLENQPAQLDYLKAQEEMSNYLASLTPASNLRVALGTIGRGFMVATLKSPMVNIISHATMVVPERIVRRVEYRQFQGANNEFANQVKGFQGKVFAKTGYDLSRWDSLGGERKSLGEDYMHSQGPGPIRWMGRFVENTVFAHLHGDLYQKFASNHFADSANLQTTAIAKAEGLSGDALKQRALELFKDAVLTEPKTELGRFVKAKAEADATYATFTNKSRASETALQLRAVANTGTGEFRLGDVLVPFAKVPANALGASLEYSGVNLTAKLAVGIYKTLGSVVGKQAFDKAAFAGTQRAFVRAGLGFTFSLAISQLIKPEDFIGAYPTNPSEQKLLAERNATANSIRVGNRWISLDYLGPFGASLLGQLYAKKYGAQTPLDYIYRFAQGPISVVQTLPGIAESAQVIKYLTTPPDQKTDAGSFAHAQAKTVLSTLTARIIPGFISDIAKMTDSYQRAVDKTSISGQLQSSIPGLREGLPIKKDLFGDTKTTEPWLSQAFFGSRVQTAQDSHILTELVRLDNQNALPSITDVSTSSKQMRELKQQIGEQKFSEAMSYFGKNLKQNWNDTISSDEYKSADSADVQRNLLNKAKEATLKDTLSEFNYEKPEKP